MRMPLVVVPLSQPYAHIVRFKNGRANLLKTFAGLAKGQNILIRMTLKADRVRIQGSADNAGTRIKMEEHPSLNTIRVTSLGPQRERVMSKIMPNRVQRFKTRISAPQRNPSPSSRKRLQKSKSQQPQGSKGQGKAPDIFS